MNQPSPSSSGRGMESSVVNTTFTVRSTSRLRRWGQPKRSAAEARFVKSWKWT